MNPISPAKQAEPQQYQQALQFFLDYGCASITHLIDVLRNIYKYLELVKKLTFLTSSSHFKIMVKQSRVFFISHYLLFLFIPKTQILQPAL
ncbi:MAG: hypothetical protein RMX68_026900 [Aulosira sp. ZfuVER01]|nr:hypothetical protein [Aulosira sp. ZfuVER01]MDZ8000181.1 hypothetical protein [Aulosira sp. DedVER01a]MDZ8055689.1 hypothetical protein [Aulosira sp. ZfuCHP01]